MKRNRCATFAAAIACIGLTLPSGAFALETAPTAFHATDVALGSGGLLVGHVVDANGAPKVGAVVAIAAKNARMAWAVLDRGERFQLPA